MHVISNILETIPEAALRQASVRKEHSVLLVIDMQKYFREIAGSIVENLSTLIRTCREESVPVVYTQHGYEDPDGESGMLGEWWGDPIVVGTEEWDFMDDIAPLENEKVIRKKRYSAFYRTDLEEILRTLGITDIIIGGVMTNLCCETTARDAFVRDFRVFFLVDGTATVSEEYHFASLRNLAYGFAYLKQCEEIIEVLRSGYE
ncbi:MAG: isochorismatase family protein [bacterium]